MACNHNCSGSCNSCNSCGSFGTLNCVAGPLTHCGSCAADSQNYQNFPYYSGPCGSVNCTGCGCSSANRYRYGWGWGCGCNGSNWNGGWNSGWNGNGRNGCGCGGWNGNGWNRNGWNGNGRSNCGCDCECSAPVSECASRLCGTSAHFASESSLMVEAGSAIPLTPSVVNQNYFQCSENGILIRKPGTYMVIYSMHVPAMQPISTRMYLSLNGNVLEESIQDITTVNDGSTGIVTVHMIFHALPNSLLKLVSTEDFNICSCDEVPHVCHLSLMQMQA